MSNIVIFHVILQKVASLMEQTEGNDSLHDTDTLSTEDSTKTKGGHIVEHFPDRFRDSV